MKITRTKLKEIQEKHRGHVIEVAGWVRTIRNQKSFAFIELYDGSCFDTFQIVIDANTHNFTHLLETITTGCSIRAKGEIVKSPGTKQPFEMKAHEMTVIGTCSADEYPLQKKRHTFEYLRNIAHLRPRTQTQGAVARLRNCLFFASHEYFQKHDFLFVPTPIITASDCEGGGEQFLVTTLDLAQGAKAGKLDHKDDFFKRPAYLTVSGQLNGEVFACALSDIYTFGPTFRAENSNTSRHLAEFWMLEPEMAFADLSKNMDVAEGYLKYVINKAMELLPKDLEFFDAWIEKGLITRLKNIVDEPFARMSYTEAIEILKKAPQKFEFPVSWGLDLQSEHERYLAEVYCQKPVILTDYPKEIKAFYMRENEEGKTVAAMDILVPKIGEIVGGSQREERLDHLEQKIAAAGLDAAAYWWYLELRKYGSVPHSGFGVGFERLMLLASGLENIRDVSPFPRYPGHAEF